MFNVQVMLKLRFIFALVSILAAAIGCTTPKSPGRFESVQIRGTPMFVRQVENALGLLKTNSPTGYAIVTNYVGIVEEAKRSGMRAWSKPPKFELNKRTAFYSVTWCAGTIAHDSFHSKLYADYLRQHPKKRVPDEIWTGEEAERRCSEHQVTVLKEIGASAHEITWCADTNRYWEVKYRNRTW
jgi:hypothetical protein